jgi:hypothetical protein
MRRGRIALESEAAALRSKRDLLEAGYLGERTATVVLNGGREG